jgi:hypothetical protein
MPVIPSEAALGELLDRVSTPAGYRGRRVRALRIGDPADLALLQAVARGEFAPAGFPNRDLRQLLHGNLPNGHNDRALSAKVGRQLRLLRAHHVIRKISRSNRCRLTKNGHLLTSALFAMREASINKLVGTATA